MVRTSCPRICFCLRTSLPVLYCVKEQGLQCINAVDLPEEAFGHQNKLCSLSWSSEDSQQLVILSGFIDPIVAFLLITDLLMYGLLFPNPPYSTKILKIAPVISIRAHILFRMQNIQLNAVLKPDRPIGLEVSISPNLPPY